MDNRQRVRKSAERTVLKQIQSGKLIAKRDGKRWLIKTDEVSASSAEPMPNDTELISVLKQQLEEKDKQIENLLKQVNDKDESQQQTNAIIMQLTRQLENSQRMLETGQRRRGWWSRLFKRTPDESN